MNNLVKDLERKLAQSERKIKKLTQKLQEKRKAHRSLQVRYRQVCASKQKWKEKAKARLKAFKPRFRVPPAHFGGQIPARHQYGEDLIALCAQLRLQASCSYRSIARILKILFGQGPHSPNLPCANTVQNWVEKLGLSLLQNPAPPLGKPVLIVDELMGRAQERLLMFLLVCRCPGPGKALDYSCVQVVHLEARPSWSGEEIAQVMGQIQSKLGQDISYLLSDGDYKLLKAARELGVPHQPDLSHFLARALRHTFEKDPDYIAFTHALGAWRAHSVCSPRSPFAPPKQRAKARFMNQEGLLDWYEGLEKIWGQLSPQVQKFFEKHPQHQPICRALREQIQLAGQLKGLVRSQGFQGRARKKARKILRKRCRLAQGYSRKFALAALPFFEEPQKGPKKRKFVFSDIIESLFGKYKSLAPSNPMAFIGPTCLQLPAHSLDAVQIRQKIGWALEDISCSQLWQWKQEYLPENQVLMKNKTLKSVSKNKNFRAA